MLKGFLLAFSQWTSFLVTVPFLSRLLSREELRQEDPVLEEKLTESLLSSSNSCRNNQGFL